MNRSQLGGAFWLGISIFVCIESIEMEVGTFRSPGPGLLPFWSAFFLGSFSIVLIVTSSIRKKWKEKIADLWKGMEWKKVIWVLCALFLYLLLLPVLGYCLTTFGLMIFLLSILQRSKLWIQVISAAIIVFMSYVVFCRWLEIRLPEGIFGF